MLSLSRSAVGAALADLEGQLGVRLFDPGGETAGGQRTRALVIPARWHCWSKR